MNVRRIISTESADELINRLREKNGQLMFHQSGGCCDGSQPMCFAEGEIKTGRRDVCMGVGNGCRVYMSADQWGYWKHTQLILDVMPGRGSSFSLVIPFGVRFLTRSCGF